MIADIIILAVVVSYCGFVIRRYMNNRKKPKVGCSGFHGNGTGRGEKSYCGLENTGKYGDCYDRCSYTGNLGDRSNFWGEGYCKAL